MSGAEMEPPFEFGQEVWIVYASTHYPVSEPCPICFGNRSVVLTLGSGETVDVMCDFCARGCDPPTGRTTVYRAFSRIERGTVTGLEHEASGDWVVFVGHHREHVSERKVFADQGRAEARRIEMHAESEASAQRSFEQAIGSARRKTTWTAGYHRREIAELERRLAWHREKLQKPKPRAETVPTPADSGGPEPARKDADRT